MCIIISAPAGKQFDVNTLYEERDINPDGIGLVYWEDNGEQIIEKALDEKSQYELLAKIIKLPVTFPRIVHMRIATHGHIDLDNCHPYTINNDWVLMHNGIMSAFAPGKNSAVSDTAIFTKHITELLKLNPDLLYSEYFQDILKASIGSSRLVFISLDPDNAIYLDANGESFTDKDTGIWYSHDPWSWDFPLYDTGKPINHKRPSADWSLTSFGDNLRGFYNPETAKEYTEHLTVPVKPKTRKGKKRGKRK